MSISILNRGASGGLKPELTVTAPAVSTIDLLQGGIVVDTYTLGASETEHTFVVKVGTYAVRGTFGTKTAEVDVTIDAVGQYVVELMFYNPVFADNTWAEIIEACQNDAVPDTWTVGSQKTMTINGYSNTIDIIGINHDAYSTGGTAPLTFQLHDVFRNTATSGVPWVMNGSNNNTNSGGWRSCIMRSTYLPHVLTKMPSEVQAGIREVNKLSSAGSQSSSIVTTADKLFLLSEIEVFGSVTRSVSGEGKQYAYYANGGSKQKVDFVERTATMWAMRSPAINSSASFCRVDQFGGTSQDLAGMVGGLAFAFCF